MGSGKTSFVGGILCDVNDKKAFKELKQRTVAFYICRYEVQPSSEVTNFIKMLSLVMAEHFSEYKQEVIFGEIKPQKWEDCSIDEEECFKRVILFPLERIQPSLTPRWIIIDALEDCDSNRLLSTVSLLRRYVSKFPSWLKFLITTREDVKIKNQFKFATVTIQQYHDQNMEDVKVAVGKHLQKSLITKAQENYIYCDRELQDIEEIIVKKSLGNFLFATELAMGLWQNVNCSHLETILPENLQDAYEKIFKRSYGTDKKFRTILPVLEVMSAACAPMNINEIGTVVNMTDRELRKLLNRLKGVIIVEPNNATYFYHFTVIDWLTDLNKVEEIYFVDKINGHKSLFFYLEIQFKKIQESCPQSICGLNHIILATYHCLETKDDNLLKSNLISLYANVSNSSNRDLTYNATLLHFVANEFDSPQLVELLLHKEVDVNAIDVYGLTPIWYASEKGYTYSVTMLHKAGAKLDIRSNSIYSLPNWPHMNDILHYCHHVALCNATLLHQSVRHGNIDLLTYFLQHSAKLAYERDDRGFLPIHEAIVDGKLKIVELFLKFDKTLADNSALFHAVESGQFDIVQLLLNNGARDECVPCFIRTEDWLIEALVSLNETTENKTLNLNYPLHVNKNIYLFLINKLQLFCETALSVAVKLNQVTILKELLNFSRATVNCKDIFSRTPLMKAIEINNYEIANILLTAGADINTSCSGIPNWLQKWSVYLYDILFTFKVFDFMKNNDCPCGSNILHVASRYNAALSIEKIVSNNSENITTLFYSQDCKGWFPVHVAICNSNNEIVTLFLKYVANERLFYKMVANGNTILHIAAKCLASSSVTYLLINQEYTEAVDIEDNDRRTSLQLVYHPFPMNISIWQNVNNASEKNFTATIQAFLAHNNQLCKLHYVDRFNHSLLHYAVLNYDYKTIELLNNYQLSIKNICKFEINSSKKDFLDQTLLDMAIHKLNPWNNFSPVYAHANYNWFSIFDINNQSVLTRIFSAPEMTIFYLLSLFKVPIRPCSKSEHYILHTAITKSYYHVVMLLIKYGADVDCIDISGNQPINAYLRSNGGPYVAEVLVGNTKIIPYKCSKPFNESYLHILAQDERDVFWFHKNMFVAINHVWIANVVQDVNINECFDADGYTILHRAAMGNKWEIMNMLINQTVNITSKSKYDKKNLLELIIHHGKLLSITYQENVIQNALMNVGYQVYYRSNDSNIIGPFKEHKTKYGIVETAENLLDWAQTNGYLCKIIICENNTNAKELFQAAVVLNFKSFVSKCINDLNCRKAFYNACIYRKKNFTIYYFTLVWGYHDVAKELQMLNCSSFIPSKNAQKEFLFDLLIPVYEKVGPLAIKMNCLLSKFRALNEKCEDLSSIFNEMYETLRSTFMLCFGSKMENLLFDASDIFRANVKAIIKTRANAMELFANLLRQHSCVWHVNFKKKKTFYDSPDGFTISWSFYEKKVSSIELDVMKQEKLMNQLLNVIDQLEILIRIDHNHIEWLLNTFPGINAHFENNAFQFLVDFILDDTFALVNKHNMKNNEYSFITNLLWSISLRSRSSAQ